MAEEYWRWTESRWTNPDISWQEGGMVTAGVDVGSVSSQAVILVDGVLYAYASTRTGSNSPESANTAMTWALEDTGNLTLKKIHYTVGTGYGRVNVPFARRTITEIACHARGANFMYGPTVRTVLDMGGQDCKAIHCDEKGKVTNFLLNDKCAAGTGRGMEIFADLLGASINDLGDLSLQVDREPPMVSPTCVVFAKSEAIGLLRRGWSKEKVLAAYSAATVHRVTSLIERLGLEEDFAITGGIAKNIGIVSRLEKVFGVKALAPRYDTQIAGALGAGFIRQGFGKKKPKIAAACIDIFHPGRVFTALVPERRLIYRISRTTIDGLKIESFPGQRSRKWRGCSSGPPPPSGRPPAVSV